MNLGLALDDNDDIVHTHVKQMLGSIRSSPLFIRVAESMVILAPIFHVG